MGQEPAKGTVEVVYSILQGMDCIYNMELLALELLQDVDQVFTLYTVHCTLYSINFTLQLYIVFCRINTENCALFNVYVQGKAVHCTV